MADDEGKGPATENAAGDRAAGVMEALIAAADVSKVFGAPIRHGETLLLPAAEILAVAGFGMGSGAGVRPDASGAPRRGAGGGGGGGGSALARSVAVVVASPEGVRVRPVVDYSKIALAALTAAGFVWASWASMAKPRRFRRP